MKKTKKINVIQIKLDKKYNNVESFSRWDGMFLLSMRKITNKYF